MKIFNTMTKKKEEFIPLEEGKVKMYVCGPTVYNFIHIGNARPMIVFDTVRRYFEYKGYDVNYVSNFTDVDDKIIKKAIEEGVTADEISKRYIAECKKDMDGMNIKPATKNPLATEEICGMVDMIQTLIDKGFAYEKNGTVYYSTRKFKDYGKLSHKNLDDLRSGERSLLVSGEDEKEDPLDFVLWKPKKEGEPAWESPWSEGRPGWHIECSEMSKKYLGEQIDIHAGGEDLVFPHHENEIAQSRALNGHPIADTWMHNQMININNEKMSKSLGNVVWAKDLIVELGCNVYKWFMLSSHYRNPLNMTNEIIEGVKKEVAKVENVLKQTSLYVQVNHLDGDGFNKDTVDHMVDALADDLNTSLALTEILNQVKVLNQAMRVKEKDNTLILKEYNTLLKMTDVIGFVFKPKQLDEDELELYSKWLDAKAVKDFEKADQYREELIQKGII